MSGSCDATADVKGSEREALIPDQCDTVMLLFCWAVIGEAPHSQTFMLLSVRPLVSSFSSFYKLKKFDCAV